MTLNSCIPDTDMGVPTAPSPLHQLLSPVLRQPLAQVPPQAVFPWSTCNLEAHGHCYSLQQGHHRVGAPQQPPTSCQKPSYLLSPLDYLSSKSRTGQGLSGVRDDPRVGRRAYRDGPSCLVLVPVHLDRDLQGGMEGWDAASQGTCNPLGV
jgi:hypothetical protein